MVTSLILVAMVHACYSERNSQGVQTQYRRGGSGTGIPVSRRLEISLSAQSCLARVYYLPVGIQARLLLGNKTCIVIKHLR